MNISSNNRYIVFGAAVLLGYSTMAIRGVEPFSMGQTRQVGGSNAASMRRAPRGSTFIWFGGFGGK